MNAETQLVETNKSDNLPIVEPQQGVSPLVAMVTSGQYTPETIRELLAAQREYDAHEGMKSYNKAMTVFRSTVGMASKSASNGHLRTTYATFDDLVRAVSKPLGDSGFNYSFKQSQEGNNITVSCTVTHADGHSESTSLTSAIEGNKGINNLQALGLTVSYLKRYTLAAMTGVGTEDDDGQSAQPAAPAIELITESDMADLKAVCEEVGKDYDKWLAWISKNKNYGINHDGILAMPKADKTGAIKQLKRSSK